MLQFVKTVVFRISAIRPIRQNASSICDNCEALLRCLSLAAFLGDGWNVFVVGGAFLPLINNNASKEMLTRTMPAIQTRIMGQ